MAEQVKHYSSIDPYYKREGSVPLGEALAIDNVGTETYQLPTQLSEEQTKAIASYAIMYAVQRLTSPGSVAESEANYLKPDAENEIRRVFHSDTEQMVAAIKTAMDVANKFISQVNTRKKELRKLNSGDKLSQ